MTKPIPDGFHTVTPHIIVKGAVKALEFYKKAFSAKEMARMMTPDGNMVMHAQITIGDSIIMLADEFPPMCLSPKSFGGSGTTLHLYVKDADAAYDQAVKAGCTVKMPIADMFWGDRYGVIEDPFGHLWSIATHTHDYTPEQMNEKMKDACAGMASK
jgi:PhnB protein